MRDIISKHVIAPTVEHSMTFKSISFDFEDILK